VEQETEGHPLKGFPFQVCQRQPNEREGRTGRIFALRQMVKAGAFPTAYAGRYMLLNLYQIVFIKITNQKNV